MSNATDIDKRFHDEYTVKMIRNGRLTTLIAALLTLNFSFSLTLNVKSIIYEISFLIPDPIVFY